MKKVYRDKHEDDVIVNEKDDFWWGYISGAFLTWSSKPSGMDTFKEVKFNNCGLAEKLKIDAKDRFPIGTKFKNDNIMISTSRTKVINSSEFQCFHTDRTLKIILVNKDGGRFTIFRDGKWADIISAPSESNNIFPVEKIQKQIDTITLRKNIVLLL